MQIYTDAAQIRYNKNTILTVGTFDGIHLGHQEILKRMLMRSVENNWRSLVITFNPHPRAIVAKNSSVKLLLTNDEKIELFKQLGVEDLLIINFTKEFSLLPPEEFIKKYLVEGFGLSEIVLGHDHHFGRGRGGDEKLLQKMGKDFDFSVLSVEAYELRNEPISSTRIRNALAKGDLVNANEMLGRFYSFGGVVVEGDKRGRELGYPTANILMDEKDKLLPALGIYAVKVFVAGEMHNGLLSIGKRPTYYESGEIVPEVFIYNFDRNIYGEKIIVEMVERLRGEEKFNSSEELVIQMHKDKENGLRIFNKISD